MKLYRNKLTATVLAASIALAPSMSVAQSAEGGLAVFDEAVTESKKWVKTASWFGGLASLSVGLWKAVASMSAPAFLTGTAFSVVSFKMPGWVSSGATVDNLSASEKKALQYELAMRVNEFALFLKQNPELKAEFFKLSGDPSLDISQATPMEAS